MESYEVAKVISKYS